MATDTSDDKAKADKSGTQERSSIEFPYTDLDSSVDVARGVHQAGGTSCEMEQLAAALKMEAKGGGFRMRVTSAQTFGLIENERGGRVNLTDLGRLLVDIDTERAARVTAFLTVPLYSKAYDTFKGSPLPGAQGLEQALVNMGVGRKVADRARQVMMRSAKQAGFLDAAPDRLVKPAMKAPVSEGVSATPTDSGGASIGASLPKGMHPLIQGLLTTLPQAESPWSVTDRLNWLTMANSIFKIIYKGPDNGSGDVEILLKKGDGL